MYGVVVVDCMFVDVAFVSVATVAFFVVVCV